MRIALAVVLSAFLSANAWAAPISTLFGTGLDAAGLPLPAGAADTHYTVVETGTAARVLINTAPYFANDASSQWVWENASGLPAFVTRTFRTSFDLTGLDHTTAVINGLWGVDNIGIDILINGASTGIALPTFTTNNFITLHAFSITSGFQAGINTLDFITQDLGAISAFRVQLSGTANAAGGPGIPEPATLALLGIGLAGIGLGRRYTARGR